VKKAVRIFDYRLVLLASVVLVSLTAYAQAVSNYASTSQATVTSLDTAVQLRFHKVTPGKFGEHALIGVGDDPLTGVIDPLDAESDSDRATLQPAMASGRSVVLALMHCRFKPDRDIALDNAPVSEKFTPSVQVLESISDSQANADRLFDWSSKNIEKAGMKGHAAAMTGAPFNTRLDGYFVAVRPVTAHYPICLTCHHGTKLGDTLAAIVYLVADHKSAKPCKFVTRDGGV